MGYCPMSRFLSKGERPLDWVGSSKKDFLGFPEPVKDEMGNALGLAQFGGKHPSAKPWKGLGPGVFELVEHHDGDTYRAAYTVRFPEVVYVLHAFQKKSPSGIRTAQVDIDMVGKRLKVARQDYEAHHGTPKR
jgi:phage-related protein